MDILAMFQQLRGRGRLGHAYCLWGYGDAEEQMKIAEGVAEMFEPRPFVDCLLVQPVDGVIGIDAAREAIHFLWQKSFRAERKTLIIHLAQALTTEAQNALLKIVEEPPGHGLILFTIRDPELLVPALQSRVQKVFVSVEFKIQSEKRKTNEFISDFLQAGVKERKEMIKELLDADAGAFDEFLAGLMAELAKDTMKNYQALGELSRRMMLMQQFQTNRKLQLEAVLTYL